MNTLASLLVEIGTMLAVVVVMQVRDRRKKRVALKHMGAAFFVSGVCSYFGAKYFGLAVFGRHSASYGDNAAGAALFLASLGAILFVLHFLLRAMFPHFMLTNQDHRKG